MGAKPADPKSGSFVMNNTFSALSRGEDRKPPQPNMNSRRMTPTPSIEKEKERMLHVSKDSSLSSRESSLSRTASVQSHPAPQMSEAEQQKMKERLERQSETLIEEYFTGVSSIEVTCHSAMRLS